MLYVRKGIQDELCIFEVSLDSIPEQDFLITDGNASSRYTEFYKDIESLDNLPWDVINARTWYDHEDGKRKRCAEVLIYPKIDKIYLLRIHCFSQMTYNFVKNNSIEALISHHLFF